MVVELPTAPVAFGTVLGTPLHSQVTHIAVHVVFGVSVPIAWIIRQLVPPEYPLLKHDGISWASHSHSER